MTTEKPNSKKEPIHKFKDYNEMIRAYENGYLDLQTRVEVRRKAADTESHYVQSMVGRFIFNEGIPKTWDLLTAA